jgi:hypothetical protein
LRENKPELSKGDAIESADEIWLAAHLSLTPEHAADLATGLMKRFEGVEKNLEGDQHADRTG